MLGVVRAVSLSRELMMHPIFFNLSTHTLGCLTHLVSIDFGPIVFGVCCCCGCCGWCAGVGPALGVEAVGAADKQVGVSCDGQNSDVILTVIL